MFCAVYASRASDACFLTLLVGGPRVRRWIVVLQTYAEQVDIMMSAGVMTDPCLAKQSEQRLIRPSTFPSPKSF